MDKFCIPATIRASLGIYNTREDIDALVEGCTKGFARSSQSRAGPSDLPGPRMSELTDLYQEVILDHNRRPHNFRVIDDANRRSRRATTRSAAIG